MLKKICTYMYRDNTVSVRSCTNQGRDEGDEGVVEGVERPQQHVESEGAGQQNEDVHCQEFEDVSGDGGKHDDVDATARELPREEHEADPRQHHRHRPDL